MMKKSVPLLIALLLCCATSFAQELDGGALRVREVHAAAEPGVFRPALTAVAYSNITSFSGVVNPHGGSDLVNGSLTTRLLADDLTPGGPSGAHEIESFTFSVGNLNPVPVRVRPRVRFWNADGAAGAPGSYYRGPLAIGVTFDPTTVSANSVVLLTAMLPPGTLIMPASRFWAGVVFDDDSGSSGITASQLDLVGQGVFGPPEVGASDDAHFLTSAAGSFFPVSNPPGSLGSLGGNPAANHGWEFRVDTAVPTKRGSWGRIKALYR